MFSPNIHGEWTAGETCSCSTQFYMATWVRWVEVDMMERGLKWQANIGRGVLCWWTGGITEAVAGRFQDITHEAIEVQFKCSNCGWHVRKTYEVINADVGKDSNFGEYAKQYSCKRRFDVTCSFSYQSVEEQFATMWGKGVYNVVWGN